MNKCAICGKQIDDASSANWKSNCNECGEKILKGLGEFKPMLIPETKVEILNKVEFENTIKFKAANMIFDIAVKNAIGIDQLLRALDSVGKFATLTGKQNIDDYLFVDAERTRPRILRFKGDV